MKRSALKDQTNSTTPAKTRKVVPRRGFGFGTAGGGGGAGARSASAPSRAAPAPAGRAEALSKKVQEKLPQFEASIAQKPSKQAKTAYKAKFEDFRKICVDMRTNFTECLDDLKSLAADAAESECELLEELAAQRLAGEKSKKALEERVGELGAAKKELDRQSSTAAAELSAQQAQSKEELVAMRAQHQHELGAQSAKLTEEKAQAGSAAAAQIAELKLEKERSLARMEAKEAEVARKDAELTRAREDLEEQRAKNEARQSELTMALTTFSETQARGESKHDAIVEQRAAAEAKLAVAVERQSDLDRELLVVKSKLADAQREQQQVQGELGRVMAEQDALRTAAREAEQQCRQKDEEHAADSQMKAHLELQLAEWTTRHTSLCAQTGAERTEAAAVQARLQQQLQEEAAATQKAVAEKDEAHRAAVAESELLKEQNEQLKGETQALRESSKSDDVKMQKLVLKTAEAEKLKHDLREVGTLNGVVAQKDKRIVELEENLARAEQQRRKLHNQVQELRGNVRVFARVRPFLAADKVPEGAAEPSSAVMCNRTCNSLQVAGREDETFNFDKTFAQSSSQSEVFEEVQDFVQSALDGYNVCLFAYGQTGSGKTHTMQGSTEGEMRGIIPRSVEKILTSAKGLEAQGWAYTFKVSFLEIHNEVIRDLLVRGGSAGDAKLEIRMGAGRDKQLHVPGLMEETVSEMSQIERLLMVAAGNRSVAKTAMNADSSRSHSVFIMKMSGINESKKIRLTGTLNLCDLAGSERLKKSAVTGDRLKESQAINKSLSCLSGVFAALGRKDAHIPFRDSKLTYLMQNCLSGNGKTLMMVNLSPTESSQQESMSSLRFAGKARSCELGKPKRQMVDALGTEADGSGGGSSKRHRPSSRS